MCVCRCGWGWGRDGKGALVVDITHIEYDKYNNLRLQFREKRSISLQFKRNNVKVESVKVLLAAEVHNRA